MVNKDSNPLKLAISKPNGNNAILCSVGYGPTFGAGHDIYIASNSNKNKTSYSYLGHDYLHPQYTQNSEQSRTFLAGSYNFQVQEIEVYSKIEASPKIEIK